MPFTPFHCGPGALIKAIIPAWFSLSLFCAVQVLIDIEVLYNMIQGNYPIHTFFHTYLGATGVGIVGVLILKPLFEQCFKV